MRDRILFSISAALMLILVASWGWHELAGTPPHPPVWPIPKDPAQARKAQFINTLLPAVRKINQSIQLRRYRAGVLQQQLERGLPLSKRDHDWLSRMADWYRLPDTDRPDREWMKLLLQRMDTVPADLALAQGAIESAWGTSRFARKANNYFGQWCFEPGCGMVPRQRRDGATHEVSTYDSALDSVRSYMRNLNSHPRYTMLRRLRARLRRQDKPVTGTTLAGGLEGYSGIGHAYVKRVRQLIHQNDLERFLNTPASSDQDQGS